MKKKTLPLLTVYGDGIHDDTEVIQKYLNGKAKLIHPDRTPLEYLFDGGNNLGRTDRKLLPIRHTDLSNARTI